MNAAPLARILIVDDDAAQVRALCDTLSDQGYKTTGFTVGAEALTALRDEPFDLLLTDLMMPGMDGIALLAAAREIDPQLVGVVMTGQGTIHTAVQAMQEGALDYILKPFKVSEILPVLARAVALRRLRLENLELRNTVAIHEVSQAIAHTLDVNVLIDKIADAALAQLEGDEASVMLLSDDGKYLYVAAVRGERRDTLFGAHVPVGEGIAGWVAARREPLVLDGAVMDARVTPRYPRAEIRSAVSLPIMTRGRMIGVLNVNSTRRRGAFSLGQIRALSIFTNAAAAGLEAARLYEELRKSASGLHSVAETTPAMLWMIDANRHHTFENQAWLDFFGVEPGAPCDHVWDAALHPEDRDRVLGLYRDAQLREAPFQNTCRLRRKDGAWRWIEEFGTPRFSPNGAFEGYTGACVDMTERRATEDQLQMAQKMEAIGQLTGGLAHDFNNIIGIIVGNLDLLRLRHAPTPEAIELIDAALNAGMKAAELNRRLLAFARRQPLQPSVVETKGTVESFAKVIGRVVGEDIVVEPHLTPDVWPIRVDVTQLESAVLNLAVNARDAMPTGGRLVIEAVNAHVHDADAAPRDLAPGDYVKLSVSDNGAGMTAEVLARATEPFFTTKGVGKGTGLGLSMVHGFAKQSGGVLRIYSELGVGTTVSLYLPRATSAVEISGPVLDDGAEMTGRGETILVVEDNAGMRDAVCRLLGDLGYRPTPANNAREALAILTSGAMFDLILTDVVMPGGMDGRELAKVAEALRPGTRILFTSGFTPMAPGNGEEFKGRLLSKPYRRSELARAIREILQDGKV